MNREPPNADLHLDVLPVILNVRLALPTERGRPHVLVGAGLAFTRIEVDPQDDHPTLSAQARVPVMQVGGGLLMDLPRRFFAGLDIRYLLPVGPGRLKAFDVDWILRTYRATFVAGWRP